MIMHDDKKLEDDFDDFDFDDFEDEIPDADWDEFDDAAPLDLEEDEPIQYAAPPAKRPSFFSRYFNLIIVLLAVLGGGYFFYTQYVVPAARQSQQKAADQGALNEADLAQSGMEIINDTDDLPDDMAMDSNSAQELPPMPVPLDNAGEGTNDNNLTPLPEFDGIETEELGALDFDFTDDAPAPIANTQPALSPNPVVNAPVEQSDVSSEDLESLEKELSSMNRALDEKIEATDSKISMLVDTIRALEGKIETLETELERKSQIIAAQPAQKSTPKTAPAPAPAPKTTPSATKPSAAPQKTTPSKPKASTVRWKLRAAQVGKAVIARAGSSNLQTVVVGDSVSGIGKITSVSNQSGKWVVQGTSGSIKQ